MHPEIPKLLQLQERDQKIRSLQKDLKDIPKHEAAAKAQLAGDTQAVETAQQGCREIEVKIKSLELDIQTRRNSIKRIQDQQFETRKNDEFQALGVEIQRYEGDIGKLEDQELELMETLEQAKAKLTTAQAKFQLTETHVNNDLKVLHERMSGVQQRLTELQAERVQLVGPIDPTALDLYNRLFAKKPDAAVSPLENGICGGCHMRVVSGTIQTAKAAESLAQCESCGRILYLLG
jgi:uncharacterized protein